MELSLIPRQNFETHFGVSPSKLYVIREHPLWVIVTAVTSAVAVGGIYPIFEYTKKKIDLHFRNFSFRQYSDEYTVSTEV